MMDLKENISKTKNYFMLEDKDMLERLDGKLSRAVLRRGQEGNLLTLSDKDGILRIH